MDQVMKKLEDHDLQLAALVKGVGENGERLKDHDRQLEAVAKGVAKNGERLDGVEGRLDGVERRLGSVEGRLEGVEGRLENMVTKDEHNLLVNSVDEILRLARKNDGEVRVLAHNVQRLNDKVEQHDKQFERIHDAIGLN